MARRNKNTRKQTNPDRTPRYKPSAKDIQNLEETTAAILDDWWSAGPVTPRSITAPSNPGARNAPATPGIPINLTRPAANHIEARADAATHPGVTLNVLCVHGVGNHQTDLAWQPRWAAAIAQSVLRWRPDAKVACKFLMYDDLFDGENISLVGTTEAVARLIASGVFYGLGDLFRRRGALTQAPDAIRWTAGMVAQWVENEPLRRALRRRVLAAANSTNFTPHVVAAHSLGSLITYDTFSQGRGADAIAGKTYLTFGSQIGNAFVRGTFGGVIRPLENARWCHLYNKHDNVFTARIHLNHPSFHPIVTPFDAPGIADHDAAEYLAHPATSHHVWGPIAALEPPPGETASAHAFRELTATRENGQHDTKTPTQRALLIGINEYPDPAMRLEGCVNDVFQTSALLQELGFAPENIRVALNDRATAEGIRDRLRWLLDDARPGDTRVFYFSGHGAQLESYGAGEVIDRRDECLVPHDFDWTLERAIVDDWLVDLYAQLDHGVSLTVVLDCCHSGGMTRDAGTRIRGVNAPDDINHRGLKWNAQEQMWQPREIPSPNPALGSTERNAKKRAEVRCGYLGHTGATRRLGRGLTALHTTDAQYRRACKKHEHCGPYQPLIIHACREDQFAWEYRHGATAYGAFTYALSLILRDSLTKTKKAPTFESLVQQAAKKLKTLGYDQQPGLFGPHPVRTAAVPWLNTTT